MGECWFRDDKRHRDGGLPARIQYDEIGEKILECWWLNDKLHSSGKLASIMIRDIDAGFRYWTQITGLTDVTEFRDYVKGDAIHGALRPLPIPIRDTIAEYYCYQ